MASASSYTISKRLFSERLFSYLQAHPDKCDVTFSVGPKKEKIKTVRIVLVAASDKFRKLFEDKWDESSGKDKHGIPLPDVDPEAFKIFLKLLPSESVTVETFKCMRLNANHLFSLIDISRMFGMLEMKGNLEALTGIFFKNFASFIDTPEFLNLSPKVLHELLSKDCILMKEIDIFQAACKWAEYRCARLGHEPTRDNMRSALGDCLHEIRFPLMSSKDFNKIVRSKNILSDEERLQILDYVLLEEEERYSFKATDFKFKLTKRTETVSLFGMNGSKDPTLSYNWSTVRLFSDAQITNEPPTACDGTVKTCNFFDVDKKIEWIGIGFLGPLDADAYFDVKVEPKILIDGEFSSCGVFEKRIHAKQLQVFYFLFEKPIVIEPQSNIEYYDNCIYYSLRGPNTQSLALGPGNSLSFDKLHEGIKFDCKFKDTQLVELLYKNVSL